MKNNSKATNSKCLRSTRQVIAKLRFKSTSLDSQHNILLDTSPHAEMTLPWQNIKDRLELKCSGSKAIGEKLRLMKLVFKDQYQCNLSIIGIIIVYIFWTDKVLHNRIKWVVVRNNSISNLSQDTTLKRFLN